jgi:hypothetical protein
LTCEKWAEVEGVFAIFILSLGEKARAEAPLCRELIFAGLKPCAHLKAKTRSSAADEGCGWFLDPYSPVFPLPRYNQEGPHDGRVAQWIEHQPSKLTVAGSSPASLTTFDRDPTKEVVENVE